MIRNNQLNEELHYTGQSEIATRLYLCSYNADGATFHQGGDMAAIKPLLQSGAINWLQVHGLQDAETVHQVCNHFGVDFLTVQDILNAEHLPKIEEHDGYNVVILKELLYRTEERTYATKQLVIVQGKDYLLTFVEGEAAFLHEVEKAVEKNVLKIRHRETDFLLSVLLNSVMTEYMGLISRMEDELEDLEERLLASEGNGTPGIDEIQLYRRMFRLMRKSVFPLKEHVGKLFHAENALLHKANRPFFSDVNDHLQFVLQTLEGCRDMISALSDLYLSNNDRRMNSIMKQLTVVSTIFIPLTFLAGIWGMNYRHMPELEWRYGYLFAWGVMIAIAVAVYLYFRKKRWE
ncbi:MAG: magnesium/cobalt transporter CorA [Bacteroides sp.]|nr:magnesium/cobalt transporter CorA [Bacteroides sp.]